MTHAIRSHPINILERTSKYLILLLLPLLRTLWEMFLSFRFDQVFSWLVSVRWTLAVVGLILALGWFEWYCFRFCFSDRGLTLFWGVGLRRELTLRYSSVTSVSVVTPWYYRPFHIVRLTMDTDAGSAAKTDLSVTVSEKTAQGLLDWFRTQNISTTTPTSHYLPNIRSITFFSVLTSNLVTGAFYFTMAVSQLGRLLGRDVGRWLLEHFTTLLSYLKLGIPPIVSFFFWAAIVMWCSSFLRNLERTLRFSVMRRGDFLTIHSGILTRRRNLVRISHVNALILQQNLICAPFGIFSVALSCTGYGRKTGTSNVLLPVGHGKHIAIDLKRLLPEFSFPARQIKAKKGCGRFFLTPPVLLCAGLAAFFGILLWLFPLFRLTLAGLWLFTEIPSVWWLWARILGLRRAGVSKTENGYVFRFLRGFRLMTASVPAERISRFLIYHTLFQQTTKSCHLVVSLYGEERMSIFVPCLDEEEVRTLLGVENFTEDSTVSSNTEDGMPPASHP